MFEMKAVDPGRPARAAAVGTGGVKRSVDAELHELQRQSFGYFQHETNPANGLVIDKTAPGWPASIAATGLALACYPVSVDRGFMSRAAAVERTLATLRFLWNSPQGLEPDATGYQGFYYHFLDMQTGRRAWQCELSTVDTAFLLAGALTAGMYFDADSADETEVRTLADALYRRADWQWAQNGGHTVTHGWKPESGFLAYRWEGYDEALLLYVLGLGSPSYPLPEHSFAAWASTYQWEHCYGQDYLYAGSLFTHQLSHVWIDFRGIQDAFMRDKGIDYFENSRRATLAQQQYAIENPLGFKSYGSHCWGITASEGPGPGRIEVNGVQRELFDYVARGVPYGPDDGALAPWAVVASLPFAPEAVLPAIDYCIYQAKLTQFNSYGFKASFNPSHPGEPGNPYGWWVSPWHFGLNQGPIILMIENHRSGLPWRLMRACPPIAAGLRRAGFTGGWLEEDVATDPATANGPLSTSRRAGEQESSMNSMTGTRVSRASGYGLPPTLKTAQAAMQRPDVQDMLRRLSAYQLGIFMPHQHDDSTSEFQPLPDEVMQVESGRTVSFERLDEIARRTESFLPVGWRWCAGACTVAAACEMAYQEGPDDEEVPIKHKHPEDTR